MMQRRAADCAADFAIALDDRGQSDRRGDGPSAWSSSGWPHNGNGVGREHVAPWWGLVVIHEGPGVVPTLGQGL